MTAIDLLAMLVASAALAVAALLAARRLRQPADSALEHALTVAVLAVAGVLVVSLAVGLPGWYRPLPLTLAALALAVAAWLTRERRRPGNQDRDRPRRAVRPLLALARRDPLAAGAVLLAAVAVGSRAFAALVLPAGGFDALAYHLLFVGDWVQRETIGGSELQRAACCAWYPVNAEATYAWLAVFPHADRLVGLAQVGFLVLGGLATASIARSVGAAARYAVVAGSLFVVTPVALRQSSTAGVDVAFAAAVLVTLAFMLRILVAGEAARRGDVVRFALAAAIALGIKATAIPYVALACAVLVAHSLLLRHRGAGPSGRSLLRAGALVAALLVLGSGWYIRSWTATGNPLAPYRVEAFGRTFFAGAVDPRSANPTPAPLAGLPGPLQPLRSWLDELDVSARMNPDPARPNARLGGLGPVWLLVGIPGVIAALVLSLRRREERFAAFAFVVAAAALVATPDAWWSRFTIPLASLGLAGYAYLVTRLPERTGGAVTAGAIALGGVGLVETRPLRALDAVRDTAGAPLERPAPQPGGLDYAALSHLPERARVGVLTGSRPLPYLVLGEEFRRRVVPLSPRRRSGGELADSIARHGLEYVVGRDPLPEDVASEARLALVSRSSGAAVYRVEPRGRAPAHSAPAPASAFRLVWA